MELKNIPISETGLSVRCINALYRAGILTVGDMMNCTQERLFQIRHLGQKSVYEILDKIKEYKSESEMYERIESGDSFETLSSNEHYRQLIQNELKKREIRIDSLETLSVRAYNLLLFAGKEYLCDIVFMSLDDLMLLPRMDMLSAHEIKKTISRYIQDNVRIFQDFHGDKNFQKNLDGLSLKDSILSVYDRQKIKDFLKMNDISIADSNLSTRPKGRLLNEGYKFLSDIAFLDKEDFINIKQMGNNSADEIISYINAYFEKNKKRITSYLSGNEENICDDSDIKSNILALYCDKPFRGYSFNEMKEALLLPECITEQHLKNIIGQLLAERKLEYVDYRCYRVYEKYSDYVVVCKNLKKRERVFVLKRIQGCTLESIASEYSLTRERIRQILKKCSAKISNGYFEEFGTNVFDEDYYRYFYETYLLDTKDAGKWLGISETIFNYFDFNEIKNGNLSLENALRDADNIDLGLRLKIKNYLNRDKIFVDGVWIEKKRSELEDFVLQKFCGNELTFSEFMEQYNHFLESEGVEYSVSLYYTEDVIRTRSNRLSDSRNVLWKQFAKLRYYNIDSRDYTELLETLNLDVYQNIELSTLKFFNDYPDVMEKYDIRDQYELHNLLKKIISEGSYHDIKFQRMPQILFGQADRNADIFEMMIENAPISKRELERMVREEYGFDNAVFENAITHFSEYYHKGMYIVDQKHMSNEHLTALGEVLKDDFYYIDEIKEKYCRLFENADIQEINPYNLKRIGFQVLSNYALQHYDSLTEYFYHLLTDEDMLDITPYRRRFTYVQMFSQQLRDLKHSLQIIEYEPGKIINFRKLKKSGITLEILHNFCDSVFEFTEKGQYFTINAINHDGFYSELYELGFAEWFYANILISDNRFSFAKMFGNIIFFNGKMDVTIKSFVYDYITRNNKIDISDMINDFSEKYGLSIKDKNDIIYALNGTEIFYDTIIERFYSDKELYYNEIESEV